MSAPTKTYTNGEVTIVWKPKTCIHSGVCVRGLPEVFQPKAKPWIKIEAASTEALIAQVKQCPSGALSYFMNAEAAQEQQQNLPEVEVSPNGPLIFYGKLLLKDQQGEQIIDRQKTAFCRCGASKRKPFCDGSHREIGFQA
ncbi:MAG: hypothetical protein D6730_22605 [Bacteroidetes bacterium]|nr:MAG: hypothetical protein D6730_22605 [Bacteroidota bacterium]